MDKSSAGQVAHPQRDLLGELKEQMWSGWMHLCTITIRGKDYSATAHLVTVIDGYIQYYVIGFAKQDFVLSFFFKR